MKVKTVFVILFAVSFILNGCKKEGSGKKAIDGTVYFNDGTSAGDDIAPGAIVSITYDSKSYTGKVDETTTSDATGKYNIKNLTKGDYFISAEYTTSHGFKYTTDGHGVTLKGDVNRISLNLRLD